MNALSDFSSSISPGRRTHTSDASEDHRGSGFLLAVLVDLNKAKSTSAEIALCMARGIGTMHEPYDDGSLGRSLAFLGVSRQSTLYNSPQNLRVNITNQ